MSEFVSQLAMNAYGAASFALQPFMGIALHARARKGKEDKTRLRERYGYSSLSSDDHVCVWVHAASLGETRAVLPLIRRLTDMQFQVLFTTVTVAAARIAEVELPKGAIHQYAPLDFKSCIFRFLQTWKPSLAVFVESELWPNTMTELRRQHIPQVLVNARMSERSFKRWHKFGAITRSLFENLSLCVAQTEEDARRFSELGVEATFNGGNLKFDSDLPQVNEIALAQLQSAIGQRPVWLAASTHEREELIVAKAHIHLKKYFPDILTIIAPRHPARTGNILSSFRPLNLSISTRSKGALPSEDTDIYLADTIGELGLFYSLSPCSLVGGSLIPRGGQNPIEPVRLGSAIVHGPNVANFANIFDCLVANGGSICVRNSEELVHHVAELLIDKDRIGQMTTAAEIALKGFGGALDSTHKALLPYLNPMIVTGRLADVEARYVAGE